MTTLNISLPDQKRKDQAKLESLLLEALEGGDPQEVAPEFFDRLCERAWQAIKAKEGKMS